MATETAGIREIDAGTLPDRYARGWHCLGPVTGYQDGEPHGVEAFGTRLVVFADSHGDVHVLDGYCRHMGGNLSQGTIKGDESVGIDPRRSAFEGIQRHRSDMPQAG